MDLEAIVEEGPEERAAEDERGQASKNIPEEGATENERGPRSRRRIRSLSRALQTTGEDLEAGVEESLLLERRRRRAGTSIQASKVPEEGTADDVRGPRGRRRSRSPRRAPQTTSEDLEAGVEEGFDTGKAHVNSANERLSRITNFEQTSRQNKKLFEQRSRQNSELLNKCLRRFSASYILPT